MGRLTDSLSILAMIPSLTNSLAHQQPPPGLSDPHGPADGDYVAYVEALLAWAEQEHQRTAMATPQQAIPTPAPQPTRQEHIVSQVIGMLEQRQQTPQASRKPKAAPKNPKRRSLPFRWIVFLLAVVFSFILKPEVLPALLLFWVVGNIWYAKRTVRT